MVVSTLLNSLLLLAGLSLLTVGLLAWRDMLRRNRVGVDGHLLGPPGQ